jgi:hypothetical protein
VVLSPFSVVPITIVGAIPVLWVIVLSLTVVIASVMAVVVSPITGCGWRKEQRGNESDDYLRFGHGRVADRLAIRAWYLASGDCLGKIMAEKAMKGPEGPFK